MVKLERGKGVEATYKREIKITDNGLRYSDGKASGYNNFSFFFSFNAINILDICFMGLYKVLGSI